MLWFIFSFLALLAIFIFAFTLLYVKTPPHLAFVRTGFGGRKVVIDGGSIVLPIIQDIQWISLKTYKLEVFKSGREAFITKDKLRVDIGAEFYVKVEPTEKSIEMASRSLGEKSFSEDGIKTLVEEKLISALRAVAATMDMAEIHENRRLFEERVMENLKDALLQNGLTLENVSVYYLDQTDKNYFDPNNIFDAEGLRQITAQTSMRLKEKNEIERETEVAIKQKDVETFKIIADMRLKGANNLISGANKDDYHIANIDMERDVKVDGYFDLRKVEEGEPCINCGNPLRIVNAIEIGHIFKLGTKYSESMKATFLDENGQEKPIIMGSYGIGVERIIACHIEQNHDENGIIWDKAIAPYHVHLISVNTENPIVVDVSDNLYEKFNAEKIEVIYDDRMDVSPGFKFKDADLLGMPLQVIVSERNLKNNQVEIKVRKTGERILISLEEVVAKVREILEI